MLNKFTNKFIKNLVFLLLFTSSLVSFSQDNNLSDGKFGGPFTTYSYNKHGGAISFGGGGTFLMKDHYYIGIFGQVMSDIVPRKSKIEGYNYFNMKSRFTGFWCGYFKTFNSHQKFYMAFYSKVGFGNVNLDNTNLSNKYYDNSVLISPQVETIYKVNSFFELGIGFYYDFFIGVDLFTYNNSDFNSFGINLSLRFTKSKHNLHI